MTCWSDSGCACSRWPRSSAQVSTACRAMGVHRSTHYRLKRKSTAGASRRSRSASAGGPGCRTRSARTSSSGSSPSRSLTRPRAQADLGRAGQGELGRDPDLGTRYLARAARVGVNTRSKRLELVARHRDPYERRPPLPEPERHIDASLPGEKVQRDCFYVGRQGPSDEPEPSPQLGIRTPVPPGMRGRSPPSPRGRAPRGRLRTRPP